MAPNMYWYDGMMNADDLPAIKLLLEINSGKLAGISECFHISGRDSGIQSEIEKTASMEIYAGAQKPVVIHNSIARGMKLAKEEKPKNGFAWDAIYKAAREAGKLTLLCAGSLTNIALAFLRYDDLSDYIERIIFIAGTFGIGDSRTMSEEKAALDPYAMKTILASGVKLLFIGKGSWSTDGVCPLEMVKTLADMDKLQLQKANMDIETVGCDQAARTIIDTRIHSDAEKNIEYVFIDHFY